MHKVVMLALAGVFALLFSSCAVVAPGGGGMATQTPQLGWAAVPP